MHINIDVLNAVGKIDQQKIDLVSRLGGDWYARANGEALFEVPKPLTTLGIGVDALPIEIRTSTVLTGNDLGMLGNTENLPDASDIEVFKRMNKELQHIINTLNEDAFLKAKHQLAHQYLKRKEIESAWKILLS
jgi:hypothetical protein